MDWRGAESWRSKNKGSPRKGTEREKKEKPREAPLQLLCTGGGSPLLSSLQQRTCSLTGIIRTARLHTACINYHLFMVLPYASTVSEKPPFPLQSFIRGVVMERKTTRASTRSSEAQKMSSRLKKIHMKARTGIYNYPPCIISCSKWVADLRAGTQHSGAPRLHRFPPGQHRPVTLIKLRGTGWRRQAAASTSPVCIP